MAKIGVSIKIDVTKIDKARLFRGAKGTYLDATVFIDPDNLDEYGNSGMVTQDVTKDEKAAGTKGAILGNVKVFWRDGGQSHPQAGEARKAAPVNQPAPSFDDFDDVPPF